MSRASALLRALLEVFVSDPPPLATPRETPRVTDRLGMFGVRIAVFAFAAATFLVGVLKDPAHNVTAYHDEHACVMHEEVALRTYKQFHQLPQWNPWYCGGIEKLANPPDWSLSPDFILRIFFGVGPGRKLAVFLFVVLGMEGVFRLARRHNASVVGSMMAGVAFATSYYFVQLLRDGWIFMFAYQLIPWVALSFEEGIRAPKWRLIGGCFIAWMVLCGGTYVTMYTGLVLLLLLIIETVRAATRADGVDSAKPWQPLASLATMGVVSFGITALRVIPMIHIVTAFPRTVEQKDLETPFNILAWVALSHSDKAISPVAGEFYVGTIVCALALLALVTLDKAAGRFVAIAAVFFLLACGEITPSAPYIWLRKLPLYSQLRAPFRMTILVCLFVALAGARGLTRVEDALTTLLRRGRDPSKPPPSDLALMLAALLGGGVASYIGYTAAKDVVTQNEVASGSLYTMDPGYRRDQPFRQSRGNRWDAHVWTPLNLGSLMCFEENQLPVSPLLRGDLKQEEYPAEGAEATVERVLWSPHKLVLHVVAAKPSRILVNQNFHEAWRTNLGTIANHGGLLAFDVPAGDHRVTLRFIDKRLVIGASFGVITMAFLAAVGLLRAKRWTTETVEGLRKLPWTT